jgi:hypothetical protein
MQQRVRQRLVSCSWSLWDDHDHVSRELQMTLDLWGLKKKKKRGGTSRTAIEGKTIRDPGGRKRVRDVACT